jgi:hypothetical protein
MQHIGQCLYINVTRARSRLRRSRSLAIAVMLIAGRAFIAARDVLRRSLRRLSRHRPDGDRYFP